MLMKLPDLIELLSTALWRWKWSIVWCLIGIDSMHGAYVSGHYPAWVLLPWYIAYLLRPNRR